MTLRVATYNIHRCIGFDGVEKPKRIAAVLQGMNADVAALQEVAFAVEPYQNNILTYLAHAMDAIAIAGPTLLEKKGHYGNAILSRITPERVDRLDISVPGREPRGAIAVSLRVNGSNINIVATHLGLRSGERRYQMNRLSSLVNDPEAETTILLGDFNEWLSWARPLRWMNRRFGKILTPPTFPSRRPVLALDRIWVDPADRLISVDCHRQMPARLASDHLPLVANVAI
jgi:endonuclease/exonuclease/phosphatase family metal-dependent hydrolase